MVVLRTIAKDASSCSLFVIVALELYDNQLTGELPTSFQYMTDLEMVNLNGNELWGPLPTELGALSKLDILDLSYNEFSGIIPTETGMLSNLGTYFGDPVGGVARWLVLTLTHISYSESETQRQ